MEDSLSLPIPTVEQFPYLSPIGERKEVVVECRIARGKN